MVRHRRTAGQACLAEGASRRRESSAAGSRASQRVPQSPRDEGSSRARRREPPNVRWALDAKNKGLEKTAASPSLNFGCGGVQPPVRDAVERGGVKIGGSSTGLRRRQLLRVSPTPRRLCFVALTGETSSSLVLHPDRRRISF